MDPESQCVEQRVDIRGSLLSGPAPKIKKLVDANVQKGGKNGRVDGLAYTFDAAETTQALIPYVIHADAHKQKNYPVDVPFNPEHGRISLALFPPGANTTDLSKRINLYIHGAWLRGLG